MRVNFILAVVGLIAAPVFFAQECRSDILADMVGLWRFEDSNDIGKADVGSDLNFKSTGVGFIAGSGGADSGAALVDVNQGVFVTNPIGANGGGARTNEFTILMDIQRLAISDPDFQAVVQLGNTSNTEADVFFRQDGGIGISGNYGGNFGTEEWMRLVLVVNLNGVAGERMKAYRDGILERDVTPVQNIDGRWSMGEQFLLLSDGLGDPQAGFEEGLTALSNLALFNRALTASEVAGLGGAGAAIPEPASVMLLTGMGLFALARRRR